ncbi:MAG: GIY-YIG nuclease family protein [Planctomycetes bacterium]|nr:GIY-YIG nuclease family protein [Planctomycetota bacterium]
MTNITKQEILEAIRQTARDNGGAPLGRDRFEKESGINFYYIQKYWSNFGQALSEAGFTPNEFRISYGEEALLEKLILLMRELGRYPSNGDLRVKSNNDTQFPSATTFDRLGRKREVATKIAKYAEQKGYVDIVEKCRAVIEKPAKREKVDSSDTRQIIGEVYLMKSGQYYKIGKTNDPVRRGSEIRIQLPDELHLIHSFKTDDPSGIEAYWHKRFDEKRKKGEWFELSAADVRAFRRWTKIF